MEMTRKPIKTKLGASRTTKSSPSRLQLGMKHRPFRQHCVCVFAPSYVLSQKLMTKCVMNTTDENWFVQAYVTGMSALLFFQRNNAISSERLEK